ncbi:hypothetical protein KAR10_08845 [bacterium]|nr:hypothetical protein [bacterium]
MSPIWEWIDKYGEIIIVSTIIIGAVWKITSKLMKGSRQMSEAMKLPNISGRGMKNYPEDNQNNEEHK